MSAIYQTYAPIYHRIKQAAWSTQMARWVMDWTRARGIVSGRLIDWGCGDGSAAQVFAAAGWDVLGIDQSPAMLKLAQQHAAPQDKRIVYQQGDLRGMTVERQGVVATAFFDTLNYLVSADHLQAGWQTITNSLLPGGYAIVDVNTPYEYATAWRGQYVITADTDDALVLNHLRYNAGTGIARGRIIWFAREVEQDAWRRGTEVHLQRAHTDGEMVAAIEQAGLVLLEQHTPQGTAPSATSTRLIYVAHKPTTYSE